MMALLAHTLSGCLSKSQWLTVDGHVDSGLGWLASVCSWASSLRAHPDKSAKHSLDMACEVKEHAELLLHAH